LTLDRRSTSTTPQPKLAGLGSSRVLERAENISSDKKAKELMGRMDGASL